MKLRLLIIKYSDQHKIKEILMAKYLYSSAWFIANILSLECKTPVISN